MPDFPVIIAAALVMAVGSAVQAAFGMGLALIVVPILALIDTAFIPGPMLLAGAALAVATAWRDRAAIDAAWLRRSMLGLLLGTATGAAALTLVAAEHLQALFGALILLAVLLSLAARTVRPTPRLLLLGAAASGVMGTMVGIHGPPIALVFQSAGPAVARAMLGAFFAVGYAVAIASLALVGLFGAKQAVLGVALLPGAALGYLVAPALARAIDPMRLRVAILLFSALSGLVLLLR